MYIQAALWYIVVKLSTVNVDIFSEYIFSHISCRVLGARKFDMSEEISHYRSFLKRDRTYVLHWPTPIIKMIKIKDQFVLSSMHETAIYGFRDNSCRFYI